MRVVTLLEHHPMQELVNAVVAAAQRGTDDPAAIALLLRQEARPYQAVEPRVYLQRTQYDWHAERAPRFTAMRPCGSGSA